MVCLKAIGHQVFFASHFSNFNSKSEDVKQWFPSLLTSELPLDPTTAVIFIFLQTGGYYLKVKIRLENHVSE